MEETTVQTKIKLVKIREINYLDMLVMPTSMTRAENAKYTIKLGSDLTEDEIKLISAKEGNAIVKAINSLNGFGTPDFQ